MEVRRVFNLIQKHDLESLKIMVKGMPPKYLLAMRQQGLSPLIFACDSRDTEIVYFLLNEIGADPNEVC